MDAEVTLQPRVVLAAASTLRTEAGGNESLSEPTPSTNGLDATPAPPTPAERGVQVEVLAGFDELTDALAERVVGQVFEAAGREVEVKGVEVWGLADGRAVAEVVLGRGFRGTLWMAGTPTMDPANGNLTVPDLEVLLATRNPFAMLLARGFRGAVEAMLREQVRWPTDQLLADLGMPEGFELERELMPGFTLEGTVDSISLEDIVISPAGIRALTRAHLQPSVRITSLW